MLRMGACSSRFGSTLCILCKVHCANCLVSMLLLSRHTQDVCGLLLVGYLVPFSAHNTNDKGAPTSADDKTSHPPNLGYTRTTP